MDEELHIYKMKVEVAYCQLASKGQIILFANIAVLHTLAYN